jgi:CBS domain-containing protein
MHLHGIRHLPVVENDAPITVISIRDLLAEAVEHHAKVISELERERLTMLTSTA